MTFFGDLFLAAWVAVTIAMCAVLVGAFVGIAAFISNRLSGWPLTADDLADEAPDEAPPGGNAGP